MDFFFMLNVLEAMIIQYNFLKDITYDKITIIDRQHRKKTVVANQTKHRQGRNVGGIGDRTWDGFSFLCIATRDSPQWRGLAKTLQMYDMT